MRVTVLGSGYVGLVTGACLADVGNHVSCVDVDAVKISFLNEAHIPIHEPGLAELVRNARAAGRLLFTKDLSAAIQSAQAIFIAVGTPPDEDGSADLSHVLAAAQAIGREINGFKLVIDKSTVPVGTAERVKAAIEQAMHARGVSHEFAVVSNPEFLKEGAAIADFMRPDRIVIGLPPGAAGQNAREVLDVLYAPFQRNHARMLYMDVRSAELTKYAANAMLATRISFMNELARLADRLGADIEHVRRGIGSDPRIGYDFLYAGCGYGGSCFPKDLNALRKTAADHGERLAILDAVAAVNDQQKDWLAERVFERFGTDLHGRNFALWGLAFKPNTDDMRDAPSRRLLDRLVRAGARVAVHDPVALDEARRVLGLDFADRPELLASIAYQQDAFAALEGADALLIATEWKAFRSPDFDTIRQMLRQPVIVDGRNLYDPGWMKRMGFDYLAVGRSHVGNTAGTGAGASQ
jgi:UDPglucose 6-dehydrogenase